MNFDAVEITPEQARELVERMRQNAIMYDHFGSWNDGDLLQDLRVRGSCEDIEEAQRRLQEQRADEMYEDLHEHIERWMGYPQGRFQGWHPGRYAVQRQAAIGGWITIQDRDSYPNSTAAIHSAEAAQSVHDYSTRVVDKNSREVVWPKSMEGERF